MRIGKSFVLPAAIFLFLYLGASTAFGIIPPLTDVTCWIEDNGYTYVVRYKVWDPESGQWKEGNSGSFQKSQYSIYDLKCVDGVVSYVTKRVVNPPPALPYLGLHCVIYDPVQKKWQPYHSGTYNDAHHHAESSDGMVAWMSKQWDPGMSLYRYHVTVAVYNPQTHKWIFWNSPSYNYYAYDLLCEEGVVAFVEKKFISAPLIYDFRVHFLVFDPQTSSLKKGASPYYGDHHVYYLEIEDAEVNYQVNHNQYSYGYNIYNHQWHTGPTDTLAYFHAEPDSGQPPLWVWFWDMSIGGESWHYDFGDNAGSNKRSTYHTYVDPNYYTAVQTVDGSASYQVTITVGNPPGLVLSPVELDFSGIVGGSNPPNQTFDIINTGTIPFDFTISGGASWCTAIPPLSGGPVPPTATKSISVNTSGLPGGYYECDFWVTAPGASGSPKPLHVTLQMEEQAGLVVTPLNLYFYGIVETQPPPPQTLEISNSGTIPFNYTVYENIDWLFTAPGGGGPVPPDSTETVYIDVSGLQAGTYEGDIEISAPGVYGSPAMVHVVFKFDEEPRLLVDPQEFSLEVLYESGDPSNEHFTVGNGGTLPMYYTVTEYEPWFSVTPGGGGPVPPAVVEAIDFDITQLAPGDYEGLIEVEADAQGGYETVAINLHIVTLLADTDTLSASTGGSINFDLSAGQENAFRSYLICGSLSGTEPGYPLPGGLVTLPLNYDVFFQIVLNNLNTPMFWNFMSTLNSTGKNVAQANFGPLPDFGYTMYFAYGLNDPWNFASNPVAIEVVP